MSLNKGKHITSVLTVAILCGGPSPERGISLNSARSLADHLSSAGIMVQPYYFDYKKKAYRIERAQLFSNTPSDFDFKLKQIAKPLSSTQLVTELKKHSIVFSAIHGAFGEDGEVQALLEKNKIPFVGSSSNACERAFDKYASFVELQKNGFDAVPTLLIEKGKFDASVVKNFWTKMKTKRGIVKPARSGSSIGVTPVGSLAEIKVACESLWERDIDTRLVLQPFVDGVEFTVIVLQNRFGLPVSLFPTEIEVDYKANEIFDYRKKYLPTRDRKYFCPPRFDDSHIDDIRTKASQIFMLFGMSDYARFDGWIMRDGSVVFTDFNPVSGMEQNSFLFQQGAHIGFTHRDMVLYLLSHALQRFAKSTLTLSDSRASVSSLASSSSAATQPPRLSVLFGGATAERQVSVMSGTNAWLKLKNNVPYDVQPYLLGDDNESVWHVPYFACLNHTAEEMLESCTRSIVHRDHMTHLREMVLRELGLEPGQATETVFTPHTHSLDALIKKSEFVFLALHGGMGEDGGIQAILEKIKKPFNGPGSVASKICMDKYETGQRVKVLENEGIFTAPKELVSIADLIKIRSKKTGPQWFADLLKRLNAKKLIVKPHADGCSAGIVQINSWGDIESYLSLVESRADFIPPNTFAGQGVIVEMPHEKLLEILLEAWIDTDRVSVADNKLSWNPTTNLIEVTVGVMGKKDSMQVLSPSLTVAHDGILSLEEKFQGGTGVNITPPPAPFVKPAAVTAAKKRIKKVCDILGLEGYSRIDAFMHTQTGEITLIEVNTLPALTPSTVLFHQGLAEKVPMFPAQLLAQLVRLGKERFEK